jgi:hypothetical protein
MITSFNDRIANIETMTKMLATKHGLTETLVGRHNLTAEQLDFIANQTEEDFQQSVLRMTYLLERV